MPHTPSGLLSGGRGVGPGAACWSSLEAGLALASAALLADHPAFIAAASCARRSGERFSFLLAFLALLGFFAPVDGEGLLIGRAAVAGAADFLAAFIAFAASAACSFCFSLARFCEPSRRRFSSCWIFFLNFFSFIICPPPRAEGELTIGGSS